jgi:two-component system, cell cycle response regulator
MSARVLVVDDVPANLRLIEAQLAAKYFDVVTATNGEEALAICERVRRGAARRDHAGPQRV